MCALREPQSGVFWSIPTSHVVREPWLLQMSLLPSLNPQFPNGWMRQWMRKSGSKVWFGKFRSSIINSKSPRHNTDRLLNAAILFFWHTQVASFLSARCWGCFNSSLCKKVRRMDLGIGRNWSRFGRSCVYSDSVLHKLLPSYAPHLRHLFWHCSYRHGLVTNAGIYCW